MILASSVQCNDFFKNFYWCILDLQCCVSLLEQSKSVMQIYIFFSGSFSQRLLQNIEQSSLCYMVSPYQVSVLYIVVCICWCFPGSTSGKESACQCRRCRFDSWVGKIPWRQGTATHSNTLAQKSHGQRSLAGYSPQGCKKSDTTEATQHSIAQRRVYKLIPTS